MNRPFSKPSIRNDENDKLQINKKGGKQKPRIQQIRNSSDIRYLNLTIEASKRTMDKANNPSFIQNNLDTLS